MADVHDPATRSRNMAAVRSRDTKPELLFRRGLFHRGFRYRVNVRTLPGRPDVVLKKYRAAVQIHGCFWHGHDCDLFHWPQTRPEFWHQKISTNQVRDSTVGDDLRALGWRVLTVWECALRGTQAIPLEDVIRLAERWILDGGTREEISGRRKRRVDH